MNKTVKLSLKELSEAIPLAEERIKECVQKRSYYQQMPLHKWALWNEDRSEIVGFKVPDTHLCFMAAFTVPPASWYGRLPLSHLKDKEVCLNRFIQRLTQIREVIRQNIQQQQIQEQLKNQRNLFDHA